MNNTTTKLQAYDNYKPSGVEWLGDIPEHWEVNRLASFGKFTKGGGFSKADLIKKGLQCILYGDIYTKYNIKITEVNRFISDDKIKTSILLNNDDILFTGSGETMEDIGKSVVFKNLKTTVAGGDVIIFRQTQNISLYLSYALNSQGVKYEKARFSKGEIIVHTYASKLRNIYVPIPSLKEQTAIAEFLDDKTTKIDQAIAIKQQQIDLLKERRQILIHKAVTQGINPNVKLKDSGVEWIGEIPKHWEIRRFKFLCKITTGSKNTEDKVENGKFPFYVRSQKPEKINSYTFDGEAILTAGDGAGVGKVFHYLNEKFDFHQRVYKFSHFKNIKGKLLYYYLKNNFHNVALNGEAKSTVDSLRLPLIQNFLVTIPPMKEQIEIINKIEIANKKIATVISIKEQEIEKLKEYKSSLIDGVVTGKVRVC